MSGRIRTIKPELIEDEKTSTLSDLEFRLFVSMIVLADDYGNLRGEPGLIRGTALWATSHSEQDTSIAIDRLCESGLARPYLVRGQRYIHVCGWEKHQRVDKPGKPRVPGPDDPEKSEPRGWRTYFIRMGTDGPIKIGKALDVSKRIGDFQTGSPEKLTVLLVLDRNEETEIHRKFRHLRGQGEWFRPAKELLEFIEQERFANDSRTVPEEFESDSGLTTTTTTTSTSDHDHDHDRETAGAVGSTVPVSEQSVLSLVDSKPSGVRKRDTALMAIQSVFDVWAKHRKAKHPRGTEPKLDDDRAKFIRARLAEGFDVDTLKLAVEGVWRSSWNLGQNDRQTEYCDIRHALGDAAKVEKFSELALTVRDMNSSSRLVAAPIAADSEKKLPEVG